MEAIEAREYLKVIRDHYRGFDGMEGFVAALDIALDAVAPPIGGGRCAWVFLPDEDMTPYSHIGVVSELMDWIDAELSAETDKAVESGKMTPHVYELRMDFLAANAVETALLIYKNVLMTLHRERIKEELRALKKEGT